MIHAQGSCARYLSPETEMTPMWRPLWEHNCLLDMITFNSFPFFFSRLWSPECWQNLWSSPFHDTGKPGCRFRYLGETFWGVPGYEPLLKNCFAWLGRALWFGGENALPISTPSLSVQCFQQRRGLCWAPLKQNCHTIEYHHSVREAGKDPQDHQLQPLIWPTESYH